jgi:hypothetical protein
MIISDHTNIKKADQKLIGLFRHNGVTPIWQASS